MDIAVVWAALSLDQIRARVVEALLVLAFMGFGLWALLSAGTQAAQLLALFGLSYGAANFRGPTPDSLVGAVTFLQNHLSLFYTALLFHFLMIYPERKAVFRKRWATWLLYLPFLCIFAFGFVETAIYPRLLNQYATMAVSTDLLYMCLALAALVHSWASASRSERLESGFVWIPRGLAIAIGPLLVLGIVGLAVPGFRVPGGSYLPLLGAAIPGGLALAVVTDVRGNRSPNR
jgi:hypothetical protein